MSGRVLPERYFNRLILVVATDDGQKRSIGIGKIYMSDPHAPLSQCFVLSMQITVTEPNVSATSNFLTSPSWFRILRIPIARIMVTAIHKPSGTAATAQMMAIRSIAKKMCHKQTNGKN